MIPCSSCGYQFEKVKLQQIGVGAYCRVCIAMGAPRINENPNAFGEAKHIIPPLGYVANILLAAIATRAEAGELGIPDVPGTMKERYAIVPGEVLEIVDAMNKACNDVIATSKVEGTDFVKIGPFYVKG